MSEFVDRLLGETHDVQVDDLPVVRPSGDIDDTSEEGLDGVTGDDERAGLDSLGLVCAVEEGPDVAGLVDLLDVGGEGDGDVVLFCHGCLPT